MKFFTDETIQRHIKKYGREAYIQEIQRKLVKGREVHERQESHLKHILNRVENNFKD